MLQALGTIPPPIVHIALYYCVVHVVKWFHKPLLESKFGQKIGTSFSHGW